MADHGSASSGANLPALNIPISQTTVKVSVIDTTTRIANLPWGRFVQPHYEGLDYMDVPSYSFLVEHSSGRKVLFDLGGRKDLENLAPVTVDRMKNGGWITSVEKGVAEILDANGVQRVSIEAVIWSHSHWDHIGDMTTFPSTTALVVGPGFKEALIPGWPSNPKAPIKECDYSSRVLQEIQEFPLSLGRYPAYDYFGDGSFYLLSSPGHCIAHLSGLARTTLGSVTDKDTFVLLGGDSCHHSGQMRPSAYLPLPEPCDEFYNSIGEEPRAADIFKQIHYHHNTREPFLEVASHTDGSAVAYNPKDATESIQKLGEFDAHTDQIFVIIAHEPAMLHIIDFFPKAVNNWKKEGWAEGIRWKFLQSFKAAFE